MELNGKRILIVKQSSLGDIVHTLPLVHAIRRQYPGVFIGWIVERGFAAMVERDSAVNAVYPIHIPSTSDPQAGRGSYWRALLGTMGTLHRLRQQFRQHPYDVVLDLHGSFRSGLLGLANPGGVRVGFKDAREGNTWFQHRLVENDDQLVAVEDAAGKVGHGHGASLKACRAASTSGAALPSSSVAMSIQTQPSLSPPAGVSSGVPSISAV